MGLINKITKILFSKLTIGIMFLTLQIVILILLFQIFNKYVVWLFGGFNVLSIIIVLYLINSKTNPSYKIGWIVPVLVFPVLGVIIFLMYTFQIKMKLILKKLRIEHKKTKIYLKQDKDIINKIKKEDREFYNLSNYLYNCSDYPVYKDVKVKYFKDGESKFNDLLIQLKKAKKFIFLEYFIIEKGHMWNSILEILKEKVKEGVEVRVMYDGMGCIKTIPQDYYNELLKYGIKCKVFFPVKLELSFHQNNRDHRKILVIDGKLAYTGGINLADEYINKRQRFGHWKDSAIRLEGNCVNSFTLMFLEMWNLYNSKSDDYVNYLNYKEESNDNELGYVIPYSEYPLDKHDIGKRVYMDILNTAKEYVDIVTPYLILDDELLSAIKYASGRGVRVRIIMPHVPDKKFVYYLGRSYYRDLIENNVEIYEYKHGFIHSKMFISDNIKAVVGTINLDYRSLYLHFECACYLYKNKVIDDIQKDYDDTINNSIKITMNNVNDYSLVKKIIGRILRFLAPLL